MIQCGEGFPIIRLIIGGLVIDWVGLGLLYGEQVGWIIAAMLAVYNVFLCWAFFRLILKKAVCVGLAMGILTNPILWMPVLEHLSF